MKTLVALFVCVLVLAVNCKKEESSNIESFNDTISYVFGLDVGNMLKNMNVDINKNVFFAGIEDARNNTDNRIDAEALESAKMRFSQQMREEQVAVRKKEGEDALKAGEAFLLENKNKTGVTTTASGLQYEVIKKGSGPKPKATENVTVHYRGMLVDSTEFDSSYKRGKPVTFPVNGVIPGWTEALMLMNAGSQYKLFIPSKLGYGETGAGKTIPPNSTLIFDVELISIAK